MPLDAVPGLDSEGIDYPALVEQFQRENERLRLCVLSLRQSSMVDLAYWWNQALSLLDEPKYQVVLMVALPVLLTLIREVFKLIQRNNRRGKQHEG